MTRGEGAFLREVETELRSLRKDNLSGLRQLQLATVSHCVDDGFLLLSVEKTLVEHCDKERGHLRSLLRKGVFPN